MLRKLMCLFALILLLSGLVVAKAEDHVHVYDYEGYDLKYVDRYESQGASGHIKYIVYIKSCKICGGASIVEEQPIYEAHALATYDYHNGDAGNHVYHTYCMACDYSQDEIAGCDCPPDVWPRRK